MARERMAKLIKYVHFEGRTGHIIIYFMSSQILHHQHVSLDLGGLKKLIIKVHVLMPVPIKYLSD